MPDIIVYTKDHCPYCVKAKGLLTRKKLSFREVDIGMDAAALQDMLEKTGGRRTVPQIVINGKPIGGCDDLYALDASGQLDAMLAGKA